MIPHRLLSPRASQTPRISQPVEVQDLASSLHDLVRAATADRTKQLSSAAWGAWLRFTAERNIAPNMPHDDPNLDLYLAYFKTALYTGALPKPRATKGTRSYASGTAEQYAAHVYKALASNTPQAVSKAVSKGMAHLAAINAKPRFHASIEHIMPLLSAALAPSCRDLELAQLAFLCLFLTLSIARSQSALSTTERALETGAFLQRGDIHEHRNANGDVVALRYPQRYLKGDPTGARHDHDDGFWFYIAVDSASRLNILPLYHKMLALQGPQSASAPLLHKVAAGKALGIPLTYGRAMTLLKHYFNVLFPSDDTSSIGFHSFRRAGCTLALMTGLPVDIVKYLGAWRSNTFTRYFRFSADDKTAMSRHMLATPLRPLSIIPTHVHSMPGIPDPARY